MAGRSSAPSGMPRDSAWQGWLMKPLHGAIEDARRPLIVAAEFEPRVLFNAKPGGIAPNHLERMATDLAAAAAAARRLDEAATK